MHTMRRIYAYTEKNTRAYIHTELPNAKKKQKNYRNNIEQKHKIMLLDKNDYELITPIKRHVS